MSNPRFWEPNQGDGDWGYSVEYPNQYGGYHRTWFDRSNDRRYSWDTDHGDNYIEDSGHWRYNSPIGGEDFDPRR